MLRALVDAALAALLAPECATCGAVLERPLDGAVCAACWSRVVPFTPPLCVACGFPLPSLRSGHAGRLQCHDCAVDLTGIDAARAAGAFEGAMAEVVHALKYGRRPSVARPLAVLMRRAAADVLAAVDLVVPVPLHPARERERGFNQAQALASDLGPPVCRALRRVAATPAQAGLTGHARRHNVRAAFALAPGAALVRGRTVALVDDVLTTGATLSACAATLAAAEPLRIVAVTAARAARARHA